MVNQPEPLDDELGSYDDQDDSAEPETLLDDEAFDEGDLEESGEPSLRYRGASNDPAFGYLIALALIVGLTPLIPANADLRYAIGWGLLTLFGALAWLLGGAARIGQERLENVAWGVVFGLIIAAPLLMVGGGTLTTTVHLMFQTEIGGTVQRLPVGAALAFLFFAMPTGETLFFRGLLQQRQPFWLTGFLASIWSILLFFPMIDVAGFPVVAIIIGTALVLMNQLYSYVRERNGLAAAWICQIVVNLVLLFIPYLGT